MAGLSQNSMVKMMRVRQVLMSKLSATQFGKTWKHQWPRSLFELEGLLIDDGISAYAALPSTVKKVNGTVFLSLTNLHKEMYSHPWVRVACRCFGSAGDVVSQGTSNART